MANMTEILKEYSNKLNEQTQILLQFSKKLSNFHNFFQDKTTHIPPSMVVFLDNLYTFHSKIENFCTERLTMCEDIEKEDTKTNIMLRDIAPLIKKAEKLTKTGNKLTEKSEIFVAGAQLLVNIHLDLKANAERSQN